MKFFDFGAFQKIMKMLSREKIIFHMLFGASHDTHRIQKYRGVTHKSMIFGFGLRHIRV